MKKFVIGVVALVIVLGGGYWFWAQRVTPTNEVGEQVETSSQSQEDNSAGAVNADNWKTYTNEKFGYEVKYPSIAELNTTYADSGKTLISGLVQVPDELQRERESIQGEKRRSSVSISVSNPTTKYRTPCEWFYSERDNFADINAYDKDVCTKGGITPYRNATGDITTFSGESAYVFSREEDGTDGGLYAVKSHTIVFFHDGRPWEIHYNTLPDNPTDKWKNHPYYTYLEQSVPITQAILDSFKFTM